MYLTTHAFRNFSFLTAAAILFALLVPSSVTQAQDADYEIDPALYQALEWRDIGPARGGRSAQTEKGAVFWKVLTVTLELDVAVAFHDEDTKIYICTNSQK